MKRIVYRWIIAGLAIAALIGILVTVPSASAQVERPKHVQFKASVAPADPFSDQNAVSFGGKLEFRRGETLLVVIEGQPELGWHTYPAVKRGPDQSPVQLSKVSLKDSKYFAALWPVTESEPELVDEGEGGGKLYEYKGPFTWALEVLVRPDAPAGQELNLEVAIRLEVCENLCVWEDHTLTVPVHVSTKEALPLSPELRKQLQKYDVDAAAKARASEDRTIKSPTSSGAAASFSWQTLPIVDSPKLVSTAASKDSSLWGTIVTAVLGGFISLLTPCVFPMIPVTVSFFLKRGENSSQRPLTMAAVYCATIVAVMTAGGVALVRVLQVVSQHYLTNIFLTAVFVFFALSLLGMYEIALPSSLANLTGTREGKGGLAGIVFMALTFSIISFACVGPIYGGFITLEGSQSASVTSWLRRILGPLAFSLAFASPFFVLALFPSLLRSMPKSGSWMNSVKVVMGFLELAAALKFVRAAELSLRGTSEYFTFDLCLGIYVALCVACGLYLLNVYRLPHDHEAAESIGVPRLMFGLMFLSFALYLLPGMFKQDREHTQKPRGVAYEWVRSFLLPDERSDWQADLGTALAQAEKENKPIFIDFTGVTCPNCRLNESQIFSQPRIQELFQRFITVQLHTDAVPAGIHQVPDAEGSAQFRDQKFGNNALPYYVVLKPRGKTVEKLGVYDKGLIDSPEEFADFLNKTLEAAK